MANEPNEFGGTQPLIQEGSSYKIRTQKILVEILDGPAKGKSQKLVGPDATIGSGQNCDLRIEDPTVSRHHLTLRLDQRGLRVIDAGSRNSTLLDGVCVNDAYARRGSTIEIGRTTLRLEPTQETVELPLSSRDRFGALVGASVAMRRMYSILEKVAKTDATILIEGETGTGKELVAEALHEESLRADGPFVIFDCSAVSPTLMESELFGHMRGAFTGADRDRTGAMEEAAGGTLFFDEIGELPLELQPKLLRALESREVRPVGGQKSRHVDVRFLAATNRNLALEIEQGRFREDLFYRLAVVRVPVPSLSERAEDIPLLVNHFEHSLGSDSFLHNVTEKAIRDFQARKWPGNVRELRNAVEQQLATGNVQHDKSRELGVTTDELKPDFSIPLRQAVENYERAFIQAALRKTGGRVRQTAELTGTNRKFIWRAVKKYKLRTSSNSSED